MKALVVTAPGDVATREWPTPDAASGDVLVAPELVGLCGTDLELLDGTIDPAYVRYPLVLGHEWVGRLMHDVADVGQSGSAVVVEGVVPCDECASCHRGETNLCEVYDEIGFTRAGAAAEVISVPSHLVHVLGEDVSLDDAVLIEPMAVVWRALTRVALRRGLRVVVIGDGTIALLAAHLVRLFSPAHVTVAGRRVAQAPLAREAGADDFVTTTPEGLFDLVIEAAGTAAAVTTALTLAERGAMVILLGLPAHGTVVDFAPDDVVNRDLMIQGSFAYTRAAFADVVARVNQRDLRPGFLITQRFSLAQAVEALSALRGGADDVARGKVLVEAHA